jgi:hypothetical protein
VVYGGLPVIDVICELAATPTITITITITTTTIQN